MLPGFDGEVLLVACACALSCAIPGSFLFLARRTMQIEAVSHAVLLGVVGAYLVRGGDSIFLLFGSALLSAVLAIQGSAVLERRLRFYRQAATAIASRWVTSISVRARSGKASRHSP